MGGLTSHVKEAGCSSSRLVLEIADFDLSWGAQDRTFMYLPTKVSLRDERSEIEQCRRGLFKKHSSIQ